MPRWVPGAAGRLQEAALDLFVRRGFEQTTTAEIAAAVGLTERTFFRHFADKREVLFHGQQEFTRTFLDGVESAPEGAEPMVVVAEALLAGAALFPDERRPHSRTRQSVIDANPGLLERERHKLATLATGMADVLRERGVAPVAATLAAESGATVFATAFAQWLRPGEGRSLDDVVRAVLADLAAVTGAVDARRGLQVQPWVAGRGSS